MRRITFFIFAALLAPFISMRAYSGESQLAHAIFVKVNGQTITQEQVVEVVKYLVKQEYNDVMPQDEAELEKLQDAALRNLVRSILIHAEARKAGVTIAPGRLKGLIRQAGMKPEEVTPTIRRLIEADDMFEDMMAMTGTPIRDPSPRQIKNFFNENREDFRTNSMIIVRTIFLADDGRLRQAALKAEAEKLVDQVKAVPANQRTAYFDRLAREVSQDVFGQFGGLLTGQSPERWIPKDFANQNEDGSPIFPPTMMEAIRRLNRPGEVRLAVSEDGMHLVYCENVQGGQVIKWDEARNIIEYVLKTRLRNRHLRTWLNQIYDRSDVRWHDGTVYEKENLTKALLPSEQGPMSEF